MSLVIRLQPLCPHPQLSRPAQGLTGEISEDCEHSQALEAPEAATLSPSGGQGPSVFSSSGEGCSLPQPQMAEKTELEPVLPLSAASSTSLCFLQSQGSLWLNCQKRVTELGKGQGPAPLQLASQTPSTLLTQTRECPVPRKQLLDRRKTSLSSPNPKGQEFRLS